MSLLRDAFRRIRPRLVKLLCGGYLLLLMAGLLWLRIPDSHLWQLLLSFVLAAVITAVFLGLHAFTLQSMRQPLPPQFVRQRLWLASILLLGWLALGAGLWRLMAHLGDHISDRAGFWNSRFSSHLRTTFTYPRLVTWQEEAVNLLLWTVLPALLLPWIIESMTDRALPASLKNAFRVLGDWRHWIAVLLVSQVVLWITPRLTDWHPVDSVSGEIVSALLRLLLVFGIDLALLLFLLAMEAELLARHDVRRHALADPAPDSL